MKKNITSNIKAVVLALILTLGVGYSAAQVFTGPECSPPYCNTGAPINVSHLYQTKYGPLGVGGLAILGDFYFLQSTDSNSAPKAGQVLTSVDTTGKVKWADASASGGGINGGSNNVFTYSISYDRLMNNPSFRTWLEGESGGSQVIRPVGAARINYIGLAPTQTTANRLCSFFTDDSVALNYTVTGLGSDNNNNWLYWDGAQWRTAHSSWVNSSDITELQCLTTKKLSRGDSFLGGSILPYPPHVTQSCDENLCRINAGSTAPPTGVEL